MALVPLRYSLRSLTTRKSSTLLTVASIAATVAVLAGMISLQQGFATMFVEHGREDVAVFLRKGATSEGESSFPRDRMQIVIKETPEIAEDSSGQPLAAAETYLAVRQFKVDGGETNIPLRGVQPATFAIYGDKVQIVEGAKFAFGSDEVIVGRGLVDRVRNAAVGQVIVLNLTPFRVAGVFEGTGAQNSEIWGDVERIREALEMPGYSRVIAQLADGTDLDVVAERFDEDERVPCKVQSERDYLASQTGTLSEIILGLGVFLAVIMGIAAVFTGTNAMFSQVQARMSEIGILRSIGFRPFAVFVAFELEAILLGLLGGLLGLLLVLPLHGVSTGTMNPATFSEVTFGFRFTGAVMLGAIGFSTALGLVGGAIPALRAARLTATEALRRR